MNKDKALEHALELYQTDVPVNEIVRQTGVYRRQLYDAVYTDPTIKTRHERLPDDATKIAQMYRSGVLLREIRNATGRSYATIYKYLDQLNVPRRGR